MKDENQINVITKKIIGCSFNVSNQLGCGFLEKVYHNAMIHELNKIGLSVQSQKHLKVIYDGVIVGDYIADLVVEEDVIVELKHVEGINNYHLAQCLNYLKATQLRVGLLINFGTLRIQHRRVVNNF